MHHCGDERSPLGSHLRRRGRCGPPLRRVRSQGSKAVDLKVSHAFHSPLMQPIVDEFRCEIADLTQSPRSSRCSPPCSAGRWKAEMDADYRQTRSVAGPVSRRRAVGTSCRRLTSARPVRVRVWSQWPGSGLPPKVRSLPLCDGLDSDGSELLATGAGPAGTDSRRRLLLYGTSGDNDAPDSAVCVRHVQPILV